VAADNEKKIIGNACDYDCYLVPPASWVTLWRTLAALSGIISAGFGSREYSLVR